MARPKFSHGKDRKRSSRPPSRQSSSGGNSGHRAGEHPTPRREGGARSTAGSTLRSRQTGTEAPLAFQGGSGKLERLQKILAHAGLGSRRACEEYILQGRVSVDGKVVRELGSRVDPENAAIEVDGERIKLEKMVYFAVNKPKGYVSTNDDPSGRPRVIDLLPEVPERVYTVGRLDEDSTGLMILTNDGELANRLAHPRFGVEKIYRALVAGTPSPEVLAKITEGIWLSEGKVRAKRVRIVGTKGEATMLELVLAEGKKREIRRMLAKLGHKVMSLTRVAIGPVILKGLSPGEHRPLSRTEVDLLRKVAAGIAVAPPRFFDRPGGPQPSRGPRRPQQRPEPKSGQQAQYPKPAPRPHGRAEESRPPRPSRPHDARAGRSGPRAGGPPGQKRPAAAEPRSLPPRPGPGPGPGPAPGPRGRKQPTQEPKVQRPAPGPRDRKPPTQESKVQPPPPLAPRPRAKAGNEPISEGRPTRKIIGLAPRVAGGDSGRSSLNRPGARKRPPRRAMGVKRFQPKEGDRDKDQG